MTKMKNLILGQGQGRESVVVGKGIILTPDPIQEIVPRVVAIQGLVVEAAQDLVNESTVGLRAILVRSPEVKKGQEVRKDLVVLESIHTVQTVVMNQRRRRRKQGERKVMTLMYLIHLPIGQISVLMNKIEGSTM